MVGACRADAAEAVRVLFLGHTLCASWVGSLGNEAAVGAGVCYAQSRQNM